MKKKSFENDIGNDKENRTTDAKDEKKNLLRNSIEKAFKIINLKNEGNYIKRKNTIQYNSSKLKIIIDNYQKK